MSWILARLDEKPDLTMRALALELGARGVATSEVSVWRLVRDARLSFKKKRCSPPSKIVPTWRANAGSGRSIRQNWRLSG
ncbi:hypothetical protein, partial [Acidocella sp. MX-AZ02]|uniref:hypothetical protein n=1 Tax=Acidocella sp. MX-AZ02 TaxID=1214225 RepID=UPI003526E11D